MRNEDELSGLFADSESPRRGKKKREDSNKRKAYRQAAGYKKTPIPAKVLPSKRKGSAVFSDLRLT